VENNCAFCDRTQFEERIIAETDEYYCIATLGQITGGYVLVAPKEHILCIGAFNQEQIDSFIRITQKVCPAVASEYQQGQGTISRSLTLFEHGIVGQTVKHAHLHIVPAMVDMTHRIRADFPDTKIEEFEHTAYLREQYTKHPQPYLFWTTPNSTAMVCWNPPAPLQYLRIVAAELRGSPERANWRAMDPKLDRRLWSETVKRLKPYFA
jgi:diadenosine tetraphosphate (Ap4A) HIT family hydrolase